jgi:hypothetical protein
VPASTTFGGFGFGGAPRRGCAIEALTAAVTIAKKARNATLLRTEPS